MPKLLINKLHSLIWPNYPSPSHNPSCSLPICLLKSPSFGEIYRTHVHTGSKIQTQARALHAPPPHTSQAAHVVHMPETSSGACIIHIASRARTTQVWLCVPNLPCTCVDDIRSTLLLTLSLASTTPSPPTAPTEEEAGEGNGVCWWKRMGNLIKFGPKSLSIKSLGTK